MLGKEAFAAIDELAQELKQMSLKIWENPEGPYREYIASGTCADFLEKEGFRVERGCYGLEAVFLLLVDQTGSIYLARKDMSV